MKKALSLLALCLFAVVAFAQSENAAEKADKEQVQGPKITFESKTIDYGVIAYESEPYRTFSFTNSGNEPLVILNAKGSCGCTVPEWPKDPIEPGQESKIKVRYDTKRPGKFVKTVTLTTNAGDENIILTIKGEVKKKEDVPAGVPAKENNPFNNNN